MPDARHGTENLQGLIPLNPERGHTEGHTATERQSWDVRLEFMPPPLFHTVPQGCLCEPTLVFKILGKRTWRRYPGRELGSCAKCTGQGRSGWTRVREDGQEPVYSLLLFMETEVPSLPYPLMGMDDNSLYEVRAVLPYGMGSEDKHQIPTIHGLFPPESSNTLQRRQTQS